MDIVNRDVNDVHLLGSVISIIHVKNAVRYLQIECCPTLLGRKNGRPGVGAEFVAEGERRIHEEEEEEEEKQMSSSGGSGRMRLFVLQLKSG
jgi:hypothetical protein